MSDYMIGGYMSSRDYYAEVIELTGHDVCLPRVSHPFRWPDDAFIHGPTVYSTLSILPRLWVHPGVRNKADAGERNRGPELRTSRQRTITNQRCQLATGRRASHSSSESSCNIPSRSRSALPRQGNDPSWLEAPPSF